MGKSERDWKDYYEILQIRPKARQSTITAAYRRLSQKYHPDNIRERIQELNEQINYHKHRYHDLLSPEISNAEYDKLVREVQQLQSLKPSVMMDDINEAYKVLSNPKKRDTYDKKYKVKYPWQETRTHKPTDEDTMVSEMKFVAERATEGKTRSEVAEELTKKGVPNNVATGVVSEVYRYRSELKRKGGGKQIAAGLSMLFVGGKVRGIITGITYLLTPGGWFLVTWGFILIGGITLVVGIIKWLTSWLS